MKYLACGKTDKGRVRSNNEDYLAIDNDLSFFVVADGMGGHAAGEIASHMAVDLTIEHLKLENTEEAPPISGYNPKLSEPANRLGVAVTRANQIINQAAQKKAAWKGMGTTLAAAWKPYPKKKKVVIAHVGDSRIYLLRDESLKQLTSDHSVVEEQVGQGLISREEAELSKAKNMITRALGHQPEVKVDLAEFNLKSGDRLLLCSDGLSNMLSDEVITSIMNSTPVPGKACDLLVQEANKQGGKDNIAVVIVYFSKYY
ncbi:MAG: Stp1/IreP family PP2C-type Ser/Thr phosphatase [Proteobacteria bacterium]|nr:Stp1/IreP family PP2C-type Ser/Thr phosphatase [Pseudomonadota bacterium]MBU1714300.1 Stp1/IreP family PP2C-type Ser/Thr phosphatase [Pseudomonadota bacterium]